MNEDGLSKIQSNPTSTKIYETLIATLKSFATFDVENKKTSLHITHGRAFLGVHPRKDALLINIVLDVPITSPRLKKSERVSANRYHNELVLMAPSDVDDELVSWLKHAYLLTNE